MKQQWHGTLSHVHTALLKPKKGQVPEGAIKGAGYMVLPRQAVSSLPWTLSFWPFRCNFMLLHSTSLFTFFLSLFFPPRFNKYCLWLLSKKCFNYSLLVQGSKISMHFHILDTTGEKKNHFFPFPHHDLYGLSPPDSSCALCVSFPTFSLWPLSLSGKCMPYICIL